jgi:hypothetical protein
MEVVFDCVVLALRVLVRAAEAVLGIVCERVGEGDIVLEAAGVAEPHTEPVDVFEELGEDV